MTSNVSVYESSQSHLEISISQHFEHEVACSSTRCLLPFVVAALTKTTKPSKYCISGSRLTAHVSRLTAQGIMNHNITNTAATTDAKVVLYYNLIRPNKREGRNKERKIAVDSSRGRIQCSVGPFIVGCETLNR